MRVRRRRSTQSGRLRNVTASWHGLKVAKSRPFPRIRFVGTRLVRHNDVPWRRPSSISPRLSRPCLEPRDPAQKKRRVRQKKRPGRPFRLRKFPIRKVQACRNPLLWRTPKQTAPRPASTSHGFHLIHSQLRFQRFLRSIGELRPPSNTARPLCRLRRQRDSRLFSQTF